MQISDIVLFGTNHKAAHLALREQVALSGVIGFQGMGTLSAALQIAAALIYSACNRLEFLHFTHDKGQAETLLAHSCQGHTGLSDTVITKYFYSKAGLEAVRHLFHVDFRLDAILVGKLQIPAKSKRLMDSRGKPAART